MHPDEDDAYPDFLRADCALLPTASAKQIDELLRDTDMKYRRIRPLDGVPELDLSVIGIGAVKFGRVRNLKYPIEPQAIPSDEEVWSVLETGRTAGVNWIDSAVAYEAANQRLGELLGGRDSHWKICTKIGERHGELGSRYDFARDSLEQDVFRSLYELKRSRFDLLLLHLPGGSEEREAFEKGIWTLLEMRRQGIATRVGASLHDPKMVHEVLEMVDVVMLDVNLRLAGQQENLRGLPSGSVIGKKPLGSGHLIQPASGFSLAELLQYPLQFESVGAVAIGTTSSKHLKDCLAAAEQCAER